MSIGYQGPEDHERWITDHAERALIALGMASVEVSVLLCDDATIRPLNREWREKDEATDVLSFPQLDLQEPLEELPATAHGGAPILLGDVIISLDTAGRQAEDLGHSVREELVVLLVHGLAHLLGHTHEAPAASERMAVVESLILEHILPGNRGLVARTVGPE